MTSLYTEARARTLLSTDLDNLRNHYIDYDDDSEISVTFPAAEIYAYERDYFFLLAASSLVDFKSEWSMRPDKTSYDNYGTEVYWQLILYLNNIPSIEDFIGLEKILIPPKSQISDLTKYKISREPNNVVNIYALNYPENNATKYYKRSPLDDIERDKIESQFYFASLEGSTPNAGDEPYIITYKEIIEKIRLTDENITNKYINLRYPPTNPSSITLNIEGYDLPQNYAYDYTLIGPTSENPECDCKRDRNRISWADSDCIGNGLEYYLETGDILIIKYVYEIYTPSEGYVPVVIDENLLDGGHDGTDGCVDIHGLDGSENPDQICVGGDFRDWEEESIVDGGEISITWAESSEYDGGELT